jgi:hypothetical protein
MIISFFVALFTTSIVLFASRKSYQKYVEERIKAGDVPMPKEDYAGLLEDDEVIEKDENEIIKEEKKNIGVLKNKKEIFKALPINLSLLRIVSYLFLVIGFIVLKDSGSLDIASYLIGVTVAIIGITISTARNGK